MLFVRGIRGATTVEANEEQAILDATIELLQQIVEVNHIHPEDICHVWITVTHDLNATFPASAIRKMKGWELVPLMCSLEIDVAGALEKCIRFMVTVNTEKGQKDIEHIYLNEAKRLRPDLSNS